jgi:hypothetical protein
MFVGNLKCDKAALAELLGGIVFQCFIKAYEQGEVWSWTTNGEVTFVEDRKAEILQFIKVLLDEKAMLHVPGFVGKSGLPMEGRISEHAGFKFFSDYADCVQFGSGKKAKKRVALFKTLIKTELNRLAKGLEDDKKEKLSKLIARKPASRKGDSSGK